MNHGRWTLCVLLYGLAAASCSTDAAPGVHVHVQPAPPLHAREAQAVGRAASQPPAAAAHSADWLLRGLTDALPRVAAPVRLGMLVGPHAQVGPERVRFFGTDMGLTVEHRGQLYILFGDTWADPETLCGEMPQNDDTIGTLPVRYPGSLPVTRFLTRNEAPRELRYTQLFRGAKPLSLAYAQAPVAAFSDGERSLAVFERLTPARCDEPAASGVPACGTGDQFSCSEQFGICDPPYFPVTFVCDASRPDSCQTGQKCVPQPLCVDQTASQYRDGSFEGRANAVAHRIELAAARSDDPSSYDSLLSWPTNKFSQSATRAVARFTGARDGNDYRPGNGNLLYWGRPGFLAENGREAQLYLMTHRLPLPIDQAGKLEFEPQYFAGLDPLSREPTWSSREADAKPIALDGNVDGSPHETLQMVGMYSISWLDAPINKWVLLYGGDLADYLMLNPYETRSLRAPGAVYLRFADHPWGPFSPPTPHLLAGHPREPGSGYGPGGFMHHPDCVDTPEQKCVRSDPRRPLAAMLPDCPSGLSEPGTLYGPNIIDSYTQPNADGGLDMFWNVSTWNPYAVQLFKTSVYPPDLLRFERGLEPADRRSLERLANWRALPELGIARRYVQQSSRDRGVGGDRAIALSHRGNRDYNNFICNGVSSLLSSNQLAAFRFDLPICPEPYVRGAVLGRFEGSGHLARLWLGASSLLSAPADDEVLRIYVDDDPRPKIEVPLAEALDGRAGEIFAPPFGAGTPQRMSWYYPVAFHSKLIVSLDGLGSRDLYDYQCDAVLDPTALFEPMSDRRLPEREVAARQLSDKYHPAGLHELMREPLGLELAADQTESVQLLGPATVYELRVRSAEADLKRLSDVMLRVRWDDDTEPAIDVPLLDLLGGRVPPERSSHAITSYVEGPDRVLGLKLPMPFRKAAELTFHNAGETSARFELRLIGEGGAPAWNAGKLHVQRRETRGPTRAPLHEAAAASGRGRLVGVCGELEGHADRAAGAQQDQLNFVEGDVHATIDGLQALDGTGTEAYADDVLSYATTPHAGPFAQTWALETSGSAGHVSFCRWHVLGNELDFDDSLSLSFELGGQMNPWLVDRYRTLAYLYLSE